MLFRSFTMKKIFFIAFLVASTSSILFAQHPVSSSLAKSDILVIAEQMPEYVGGQVAMSKFLSENLIYPAQAKKDSIEGRVYVEFVVDSIGKLRDINIIKSLSKECDEEVLRVISMMPAWKPGRQDHNPVNVRFLVPIIFQLKN